MTEDEITANLNAEIATVLGLIEQAGGDEDTLVDLIVNHPWKPGHVQPDAAWLALERDWAFPEPGTYEEVYAAFDTGVLNKTVYRRSGAKRYEIAERYQKSRKQGV